ncbi:hypothetical protein, partial [Aggregatibacter actinomycetemcomitans]|uniref:hypothetical protein n=1 Tax=Aggregatibacter actinomycetemcomitans TaxID=714 RepID=UPI00194F1DED
NFLPTTSLFSLVKKHLTLGLGDSIYGSRIAQAFMLVLIWFKHWTLEPSFCSQKTPPKPTALFLYFFNVST